MYQVLTKNVAKINRKIYNKNVCTSAQSDDNGHTVV